MPVRCRSHRCNWCRRFKALAAALTLQRALDVAPGRARLMTFTDGTGEMTSADISQAWRRLSLRLKRRGLLGATFSSLEATKRGRLHLHVVVFETDKGGGFIKQKELSKLAEASGFGPICDVREVATGDGQARSVAAYLTKGGISQEASRLAAYLTKTGRMRPDLEHKLGERLRPVNVSQGFLGGSLSESEKEVCAHFASSQDVELPEVWELWHETEMVTPLRPAKPEGERLTSAEEPPSGGATKPRIERRPERLAA